MAHFDFADRRYFFPPPGDFDAATLARLTEMLDSLEGHEFGLAASGFAMHEQDEEVRRRLANGHVTTEEALGQFGEHFARMVGATESASAPVRVLLDEYESLTGSRGVPIEHAGPPA